MGSIRKRDSFLLPPSRSQPLPQTWRVVVKHRDGAVGGRQGKELVLVCIRVGSHDGRTYLPTSGASDESLASGLYTVPGATVATGRCLLARLSPYCHLDIPPLPEKGGDGASWSRATHRASRIAGGVAAQREDCCEPVGDFVPQTRTAILEPPGSPESSPAVHISLNQRPDATGGGGAGRFLHVSMTVKGEGDS